MTLTYYLWSYTGLLLTVHIDIRQFFIIHLIDVLYFI